MTCNDTTKISVNEKCIKRKNCTMSEWEDWGSPCSATCGDDATKTRKRTVKDKGYCGTKKCLPLEETVNCNLKCCPRDCEVSDWGDWEQCSESCGGGERKRYRTEITAPNCGGKKCPGLENTVACNTQCCKVDCIYGEWTDWDACTSPGCDVEGNRTRRKPVLKPAKCGGDCKIMEQTKKCTNCKCDCKPGDWGDWGDCSPSCVPLAVFKTGLPRFKERTRSITPGQCGGKNKTTHPSFHGSNQHEAKYYH